MKTFVVVVEELCQHELIVNAETEDDVERVLWENVCSGAYDWSNGEVIYNKIVDYEEVN